MLDTVRILYALTHLILTTTTYEDIIIIPILEKATIYLETYYPQALSFLSEVEIEIHFELIEKLNIAGLWISVSITHGYNTHTSVYVKTSLGIH